MSARSLVLSPISARATIPVETRNASTTLLRRQRRELYPCARNLRKKEYSGNKSAAPPVLQGRTGYQAGCGLIPKGDCNERIDRSQGISQARGPGRRCIRLGPGGLGQQGRRKAGRLLFCSAFRHPLGVQGTGG